jgi:hypothetical protein
MKKSYILNLVLGLLIVALLFMGLMPVGVTRLESLWIGDDEDTSTITVGTDDLYVKGTLEVDGIFYADGGMSAAVNYIPLPLTGFTFVDSDSRMKPVNWDTAPGLESDDSIQALVWADSETTPAQITFRVPSDYSSGGAFTVFATESDSTTPNQVDFDVYLNKDATVADASATGQTPVALAGTTSTGDDVALSVATDFASLAAGHIVTLRIWRDNANDGTGDLEVKNVVFYYTPTR